jgi:hypothetical protein
LRLARLLVVAVLGALVAPGIAEAHHTAVPVVALDYRNRIVADEPAAGVRASLEDAGRKLRLTVAPGTRAVVLGYVGEPFLRLGVSGVEANRRSETAQGLRLVPSGRVDGRAADAVWTRVTSARTLAWADARAWASDSALKGRARVAWAVPVVVGGRTVSVTGELTKVGRPTPWPWLVLLAMPLVLAAWASRRRERLWPVATGLAAAAGVSTLLGLAGFALGGLPVSTDRWLLFALETGLVAVAIALLSRPQARFVAAAGLAAFAILQALSELAVFRHGYVVSALPAALVRAAAAVALGCGIGTGVLVFLAPTPGRHRRAQTRYVRHSRKEQA